MNIAEKFYNLDKTGLSLKIGVVGDAMIDQYYKTKVKRISPEAPIKVLLSENEISEDYPGGVANCAYQFKNWNINAKLISWIDEESNNCFKQHGINTDLCVDIKNKISRKKRFYSDNFPIYRWDVEQKNCGLEGNDLDEKRRDIYRQLIREKHFDILIFSDYDKGLFNNKLDLNWFKFAPINIVDPKSDWGRWQNCTIFKPNSSEALSLSGCSNISDAAKWLFQKLNCKAVIVTESEKGVTVYDGELYEIRPNSLLPQPESVSGAGDTFTCYLAQALGRGMSVRESAEVAWKAGTMYVRNKFNKPITKLEFLKEFDPISAKIATVNELVSLNEKFTFTNGVYDFGLTQAHIKCLNFAKQQGNKLVVGINSDNSVKKLKGKNRPVMTLEERMYVVAGLEFVDYVVSFEEDTPLSLIEKIKPQVIVKGGDYKIENVVGNQLAEVRICPLFKGISTSEKIKLQPF